MRLFLSILLTAAACFPLAEKAASAADEVLEKMDRTAPSFTGMSADLKKVSYTKVLDQAGEESGSFLLRKAKNGLQVLVNFVNPDAKSVAMRGKKGEIYYPKINTIQEYDLGKQSDLLEQSLLVGFGTRGKELAANYSVKFAGEESVAGQNTCRLELVPKSASRREKFPSLTLWIAESGAYPAQQKFVESSGDYTVFTYSNVKLKPPLTEAGMEIQAPKNVKRERPQRER